MALGKNLSTGRSNAAQNTIMKKVRKPRFVDNAVRHAVYTKVQTGFSVTTPNSADFIPTSEKTYSLTEEEDTIKLLHTTSEGHQYTGAIFAQGDKVTTSSDLPPLVVGSTETSQSLSLSSIETSNKGTRYRVENLKGKSLADIGFTDKSVRITQKINVGLRTSDLAIRLSGSSRGSVNGMFVKEPSSRFLAQDFYGINSATAFKYLTKHDSYTIRDDEFGSLHYMPQQRHSGYHLINHNMILGGTSINDSKDVYNRITVKGKSRANNDNNVVQIDDLGSQITGIKELPGGLSLPTAVTKSSARNAGRQLLSMIKRASGRETLKDVIHSRNVHPGHAVSYFSNEVGVGKEQKLVLYTNHDVINGLSEITVNSIEGSVEDVIEKFREVDIANDFENSSERNRQFESIEFSTFAGFKIKSTWQISVKVDMNNNKGIRVGNESRSPIRARRSLTPTGVFVNNGSGYTGYAPNGSLTVATGVLVNNGGGYTANTTSAMTVDTVDARTKFAVGHLLYDDAGVNLGEITAVAATSITVGGGTSTAISENENLRAGSVTSITVDGADPTSGSPDLIAVNALIYRKNGTLLGKVTGNGSTTLEFSDGLLHSVVDNEQIFLLATDDLPETKSANLTIGMGESNYLTRRRG